MTTLVKVAQASLPELNWMVATALKIDPFGYARASKPVDIPYATVHALLEKQGIATRQHSSGKWYAMLSTDLGDDESARWSLHTMKDVPKTASTSRQCRFEGPTSLIAGLRCWVAFELGERVEVPKEISQPSDTRVIERQRG
jgi:hypothetical protein